MPAVKERLRTVTFGGWNLRVDAAETARCYDELRRRQLGPGCNCDPCRNFAVMQADAYPGEVMRLFDELGIDREQPSELSHYSRMPSGLHLYGGWHYFCGSVETFCFFS